MLVATETSIKKRPNPSEWLKWIILNLLLLSDRACHLFFSLPRGSGAPTFQELADKLLQLSRVGASVGLDSCALMEGSNCILTLASRNGV
ncbi:unnamed protein product [Protopolystoma xenopodis]|uniref:Uncharacterized protein n=1 Tax=Protopolystoma xenopodis TaxID=117903 RepID=A0A448WRL2_9PLAT|nr:unnamed protein product [Protopolystoma xenopodis]